jgi:SAM-dependent methyltransferase
VTVGQDMVPWRSLQLRVAPTLADSLSRSLAECLADVLASLENYLSSVLVSRQNAQEFLRKLPVVRQSCNEDIYDLPMVAEAYAYTHFADRYVRWWTVFQRLFDSGWLPMRTAGIQALDAGSGPGAATYALIDFTDRLRAAAQSHLTGADVSRMQVDLPRVELSERSVSMGRLVHQLSERRELGGPYHVTFPDAFDIRLARDKAANFAIQEALIRQIGDEWDTGPEGARYILNSELPDWHKPQRFHLCMFGYLLTTESMMSGATATMRHIRRTLPPGGVVVVMGGKSEDYARINLRLHRHIQSLHRLDLSGSLELSQDENTREVLKQFCVRVGRHALRLAGEPEGEDEEWLNNKAAQSMWDPDQMAPRRQKISIEVFRASDSRGIRRRRRTCAPR